MWIRVRYDLRTHLAGRGLIVTLKNRDSKYVVYAMFVCMTAMIACPLFAQVIPGGPATDEQIKQAAQTYTAAMENLKNPDRNSVRLAADEAIKHLSFESMSLDQLERLMDEVDLHYYTSRQSEISDRLGVLCEDESTAASARARLLRLAVIGNMQPPDKNEAIAAVLNHPQLATVLADDHMAWSRFMNLQWFAGPQAVHGLEAELIALHDDIPEETTMLGLLGVSAVFNVVSRTQPDAFEAREPLRAAVVEALQRGLEYINPNDPKLQDWNFDPDALGFLRSEIARLESPIVRRGTLVNEPAPEIEFMWVSGDREISKLSDLEGKIAVLDFWATWCRPCIASFPKVRELKERYEGLPVEIIGVTSIQGRHSGKDGRVDCSGNPELEMSLMPGFMEWKNMNWTVVFSEQRVFNPDYAIDGIPHVAIIDAEGKVRANGLHPGANHAEVVELIDKLLLEAGHEPPADQ